MRHMEARELQGVRSAFVHREVGRQAGRSDGHGGASGRFRRRRANRRLAPAVCSHKARGVNARHLLVTRAPDERGAGYRIAIGIARLSGQANGVSHDERSDTRGHLDGGDVLPHRDPGDARDGPRSRRDRRRSRGNRPRDSRLGNRGDRRIRAGPGHGGAGHGAALLIPHFRRQSQRVSERREQDGLRRHHQRSR